MGCSLRVGSQDKLSGWRFLRVRGRQNGPLTTGRWDVNDRSANQSRQPTPGYRVAVYRASLARRGCAQRWADSSMRMKAAYTAIAVAVFVSGCSHRDPIDRLM